MILLIRSSIMETGLIYTIVVDSTTPVEVARVASATFTTTTTITG